ncbi:MAG: branched-chain amino acid ABC transporter permease [Thermodesulfobacteriota bacterium]
MTKRKLTTFFFILGLIALVALLPLFVKDVYYIHILTNLCLHSVFAVSLWPILAMGELAISHGAFIAIGAYASSVMVMRLGMSSWLASLMSAVAGFLIALIIGYPSLRVKGAYFFLLTFAFTMTVVLSFSYLFKPIFGGAEGIANVPPFSSLVIAGRSVEFSGKIENFYVALLLMLFTVGIVYSLYHSRFGRALAAIRMSDLLAEHIGVDVRNYKVFNFAICSALAATAGSFFAHYHGHVSPTAFPPTLGIKILFYVIVGGGSYISGAILGVVVLDILEETFREFGQYEVLASSLFVLIIMLFMPHGLLGGLRMLKSQIFKLLRVKVAG